MGDFQRCMPRILAYEGGKANNPNDPGGKTNQGITQRTFNAWLRQKNQPPRDVYTIMAEERDAIYNSQYWVAIRGDQLPVGIDLVVFDAAVNSGPSQAVKWLQAALGGIDVDGGIGTKTLDAIAAVSDMSALVEDICAHRLATLQRLSTWKYFGPGWHARIANVQKTAISWIEQSPPPVAVDLSGVKGASKANVADIKPPVVSQIATHITTGGATASAAIVQAQTGLQSATIFQWVPYALGGLAIASVAVGIFMKLATDANTAALAGTSKALVDPQADAGLPGVPDVVPLPPPNTLQQKAT